MQVIKWSKELESSPTPPRFSCIYILSFYLMNHQGLNLAFQDLHSGCGDHGADVGHHALAQDLADEPVVPLEPSRGRVLHGEPIVVICNRSWRGNCFDPTKWELCLMYPHYPLCTHVITHKNQNMSPNSSSCHVTKFTVTHTEHQGISKRDQVWPGQHSPGTALTADFTWISHSWNWDWPSYSLCCFPHFHSKRDY